jgi:NAD(P)-dependent dehydrogenase (short-subunit alcohol dehydrogenase family)
MSRASVIGAGGDVGHGVVEALLEDGWDVVACGRTEANLLARFGESREGLSFLEGDVASSSGAEALADDVRVGGADLVVVAVNARLAASPVGPETFVGFQTQSNAYLSAHVHALTQLVPRMRAGATYLAVGGGLADVAVKGLAVESMIQAAQRSFVRSAATELRSTGVLVRLATLAAPITGHGTENLAGIPALTPREAGRRIVDECRPSEVRPRTIVTITVDDMHSDAKTKGVEHGKS